MSSTVELYQIKNRNIKEGYRYSKLVVHLLDTHIVMVLVSSIGDKSKNMSK